LKKIDRNKQGIPQHCGMWYANGPSVTGVTRMSRDANFMQ